MTASGCSLAHLAPEICGNQRDAIQVFLSMIDFIIFHQNPWFFSHNPFILITYSVLHSLIIETNLHQSRNCTDESSPPRPFIHAIHNSYPHLQQLGPSPGAPPPTAGLRPSGSALRWKVAGRDVGGGAGGVPPPAPQRVPALRGVARGRKRGCQLGGG